MGKRSRNGDKIERAERRVTKAQTAMQEAQARRAVAIAQGEEDIERARTRADERVRKATERVERRAVALAHAEERLLGLRSDGRGLYSRPETPAATAEVLDTMQREPPGDVQVTGTSLSPETTIDILTDAERDSTELGDREVPPRTPNGPHPDLGVW
jgi:chromosome segregation ATPase